MFQLENVNDNERSLLYQLELPCDKDEAISSVDLGKPTLLLNRTSNSLTSFVIRHEESKLWIVDGKKNALLEVEIETQAARQQGYEFRHFQNKLMAGENNLEEAESKIIHANYGTRAMEFKHVKALFGPYDNALYWASKSGGLDMETQQENNQFKVKLYATTTLLCYFK